ncbi:hypothetical protein SAJA_00270 [Salinisphaera japonica YTM-1]|uniref:Uncharacterized protein n=1 Tax=Salinisphaera japonica YTM-1 TaxID=1209778 RepID=A0A423Q2K9_9GAMM|nr:hypothetical protein SAJA_00270 [Salinisphaera japonica YTM-1]
MVVWLKSHLEEWQPSCTSPRERLGLVQDGRHMPAVERSFESSVYLFTGQIA